MASELPDDMDSRPSKRPILSFVIRIWLEDAAASEEPSWRGRIILVDQAPGAAYAQAPQLAFDDLGRMLLFILQQFERAGARVPWRWRVRRYLLGWRRRRPARRP